jgi:hypothetical protein
MKLFRELSPNEESQFRQWARDNYQPFTDIKGIWHPVVQDECRKINQESELTFSEEGIYNTVAAGCYSHWSDAKFVKAPKDVSITFLP